MVKKLAFFTCLALGGALSLSGQTIYSGNGATGFGGPIGTGSLTFSDNGSTVNGTLTRGTGSFNDVLVIYIDSKTGGLNSTSVFTDTSDTLRKGISGFDGTNRAVLNFSSAFTADYAIALSPAPGVQFGGLFDLTTGNATFGFVGSVNLQPSTDVTAASYTFSFSLSSIGLTSASSFNFVTTYLNGNTAFRSNEAIATTFTDNTNPTNTSNNFGRDTVTANNFSTYTTSAAAVPEPSSLSLIAGPAILGAYFFVRRRRPA